MTDAQISLLVDRWQPHFNGTLLTASHDDFSSARRIWNGMIDRTPSIIARCTSTQDVMVAVRLARGEGMNVSVRGGGHGVAGTAVCEGGLMIDLSLMKRITIDAAQNEAVAEAGVLWGELDRASEAHGLATTGGQISHTGIAGLTLGGGLGYLMGRHGAVCDNLLSVELVTADGDLITADEESNTELFWALRGAGANFGIATSFRYRLHPLSQVIAGLILHPRVRAQKFIEFYRDFLPGTPDELDTTLAFLHVPDGTPVVGCVVVWAGSMEEGETVLAPLRSFGPPLADMVQHIPYTAAQSMLDDAAPTGSRYYWKSSLWMRSHPALRRYWSKARTMHRHRSPWFFCLRSKVPFDVCPAMRWRSIIVTIISRCRSLPNGKTPAGMRRTRSGRKLFGEMPSRMHPGPCMQIT